ncbi:AhpC/TSA family protein [Dysgonomonas sp. 216]|uniref:TlpA disulfide reductase family protein n=1 Tax=Dysgonomonas sp. 216 TaxID=2302934 RepID=UPI0013D63DB2|nr:TlpA disulfide reductase family protein [Dysgonomonas sp. 216]NDW17965.1 AhpC/TSA family protein [Dysgonomonas sp. 216]
MKIVLSFLFLVATTFTIYANNKIIIKGTFPEGINNGKTVYLGKYSGQSGLLPVDSCVVENNKFALETIADNEIKVGLISFSDSTKNIYPVSMVVLEAGDIFLNLEENIPLVSGTTKNNEYQAYISAQRAIVDSLKSMNIASPSSPQAANLINKLQENDYKFIKSNIKNQLGEMILSGVWNSMDPSVILDLLSETNDKFKNSQMGLQMKKLLGGSGPGIGEDYIDVKMLNPEGKELSISAYIGKKKLILVDFWASWCGPCRKEMPNLVAAYEKYKDKGFEIIGISLDENKTSWLNMIGQYGMVWPQISDLKGWKSEAAQLYGVTSIPSVFLLDEKGKIIAKNLVGKRLLDKLDEILE